MFEFQLMQNEAANIEIEFELWNINVEEFVFLGDRINQNIQNVQNIYEEWPPAQLCGV